MKAVAPGILLALVVSACATTVRNPVTDVPPGNYVLVEPASDTYNAVAVNERAFTVRVDDRVWSGQHWLDAEGQLHMIEDEGPCAGMESIWTYSYSGNRITLNLVDDLCTVRANPFPQRMVYERL